ncbi:hypothetical protein ACFPL7_08140 [Dongia soli]|uniref:Uncharacterized protein n=1 Tax=Dongia soli TaxID=600628 RepID=A0ABU5EA99_9PROT|nr:hypothetical protein [Dongia soli]MDY0882915.1 hypothetical protein [Dongia soli]
MLFHATKLEAKAIRKMLRHRHIGKRGNTADRQCEVTANGLTAGWANMLGAIQTEAVNAAGKINAQKAKISSVIFFAALRLISRTKPRLVEIIQL